ncbi:PREDICTED: polygalacturonase-like [Nicotiana attenuata]|uniref:Polygalacturonase n=1 Tax=Nicotiana attenuata TaxID=49451 RepID=A0A1J6I679_NICAT|nr:PREDICTED: polygalacturonase-like [Nicotiana attenuata]OIS99971.1 polygalacturonase [Nicotiana attenuata]
MELKFTSFAFLLLFLARIGDAQPTASPGVFDVTKYGATTNGDISKAVLDAFKEACAATSPSTIVIPKGTYQMNQVKLQGPCKAPVELQVQAILKAPSDPKQLNADVEWLTVNYIDRFTLSGGGVFDGQGKQAWDQNNCKDSKSCSNLPNNLSFNFLTNSTIQDITSQDSKLFHINVNGCKNLTFIRVNITAPPESINTDGIHVARSSNVNITDCVIGTGDDCISVGDELEQLHITRVTCGPGHGISVGSLGKTPGEKPVVGVYVKNCTFINTDNGVRVKTWPASHQGVVTDLHYEDIIVQNVSNPIVIDQVYCPYNQCNKDLPSQVKISKVSIKNIRGTSRTQDAVLLLCSKGAPCDGVEVGDIDITYNGKEGPAKSSCENVKPKFVGKQNPPICAGAQSS